MVLENLPKLLNIINPVLSDKNQSLDKISSCPEDNSILNAAEDSDSGEDSNESDVPEINAEQEINQTDNEITQGNIADKMEGNPNNVKNRQQRIF